MEPDAGFSFIVAARTSKAPAELEAHVEAHGNYLADGAAFEVTRPMGVRKDRHERRVAWRCLAARARRDQQTLNQQIERAEKIAAGKAPVGKHRFVTLEGASEGVDWDLVGAPAPLPASRAIVTNIEPSVLDGLAVVAAYRDLWQVEASFRMAKSDLAARGGIDVARRLPRRRVDVAPIGVETSTRLPEGGDPPVGRRDVHPDTGFPGLR